MHVEALRDGIAIDEAERRDMAVVLATLERRGEDADRGPIILTAAYGVFTASLIQGMYGLSPSATRAMIGRLVDAGWLVTRGETRGRSFHPSRSRERARARVTSALRTDALARTSGTRIEAQPEALPDAPDPTLGRWCLL